MTNYPAQRERDGDEEGVCIYKEGQGVQGCICSHAVFMNPSLIVMAGFHVKEETDCAVAWFFEPDHTVVITE